MKKQFTELTTKAVRQFLNEQVNGRLKTALGAGDATGLGVSTTLEQPAPLTSPAVAEEDLTRDTEIETTLEELEGYQIVKAIACSEVRPQRIVHRDAKSYFAILLDDNNRKPIARLHFNGKKQRYLGLFDEAKNETREPLTTLDDIYLHAETIRATVRAWASA